MKRQADTGKVKSKVSKVKNAFPTAEKKPKAERSVVEIIKAQNGNTPYSIKALNEYEKARKRKEAMMKRGK